MKKFNLIALLLWATAVTPVYAEGVATIEKIEIEEGIPATKDLTVTRDGQAMALVSDNKIKLNDVIDTDSKKVTLKMQNSTTLNLDEKTKFKIVEFKDKKAVYELIEGKLAINDARKKVPESVIRINELDYTVSADAGVEVEFSYDNQITTVVVFEGAVKFAGGLVKQGNTAKIDAEGKVEFKKNLKTRGFRG